MKEKLEDSNTSEEISFVNSIKFRIIIVVTITFLVSAPIAQIIGNLINYLGIEIGNIGVYINTIINIIVVNTIILFFINRVVIRPLEEHMENLNQISNGKVNELVEIEGNNEFSRLSRITNATIMQLNGLIEEIQNNANKTNGIATDLMGNLNDFKTSSQEVERTVYDIAESANEQAINIEDGSLKATELEDIIELNQNYLSELISSFEKADKQIQSGLLEMKKLTEVTDETDHIIRDINNVILETNRNAEEIGEANDLISAIADQTNLLALNASIEAARAGESGRGFTIVANEIGDLADQSNQSTDEISVIIQTLQDNSNAVVETMKKVFESSEEQSNSVLSSEQRFNEIQRSIEEAEKVSIQLEESGRTMQMLKDEIVDTLQNLSAISEENAAATEQVSATMQSQTKTIEDMAYVGESISDSAEDLKETAEYFEI